MVFKWLTCHMNFSPELDVVNKRFVNLVPNSFIGTSLLDTLVKQKSNIAKYKVANVRVEVVRKEEYWGFFYKQYRTTIKISNKKYRIIDEDFYKTVSIGINEIICVFMGNKYLVGILILKED